MKIGTGYSNHPDAMVSGKMVAKKILASGGLDHPDLVMAFCSGNLEHEEYFEGLQSVLGREIPIIGGSAVGIITNTIVSYSGYPAGAVALQSDDIQCRIATADRLDAGETDAGRRLSRQLNSGSEDRLLLFFYDSVRKPACAAAPPELNTSSLLISGIEESLAPSIPVIGAGLVGDFSLIKATAQFCGSAVGTQSVTGAVFNGNVSVYYCIMHGCTPLDGIYHRVTKSDGACIFELDGQPIVPIIDDLYGSQDWHNKKPVDLLTIGINCGEKYSDPVEGRYVNRLITGVLPKGEGICLFESDIEEGAEIQFMLRDTQKMIDSARLNTEELMSRVQSEGRRALLGFYIDCAGRAAEYSMTPDEEASEVQKIFNRYRCPFFGFYSGVEVAPLLERSRGLDWTGVLVVLAED